MYGIELNQEQAEMLENELSKDAFYIWIWITQIFWYEAWIICWVIDSKWIDDFLEWDYMKEFKKSKVKRAIERLLCCWILEIENWKLKFNNERYIELNDLWTRIEKEKYTNYKWMWTYEDVLRYEEMIKYVNKLLANFIF